jgi:hypothetical protein
LNPGPHGPESAAIPSIHAGFCGFQFESSDRAASIVQIWVNLQPDYYMKYYMAALRRYGIVGVQG